MPDERLLQGRLDAGQYAQQYFALMAKRMTLTEEEDRILQRAYGDADDYEPDTPIKLPNLINEQQLRERVAVVSQFECLAVFRTERIVRYCVHAKASTRSESVS